MTMIITINDDTISYDNDYNDVSAMAMIIMMILSKMTMIIMMILSALAMIIMINGDTIRDDNYFIEASDYNYDYDEYDEDTISEDNDHDNQS